MTRPHFIYNTIRYLIDAPVLIGAFFLTRAIFPKLNEGATPNQTFLYICSAILAWYISAQFSKIYQDLRSNRFSEEIIQILLTLFLFTFVHTSFLFYIRGSVNFSTYFLAAFLSVSFVLILFFKYILRKFLHSVFYKGELLEKIILVGSTPAARDFYYTINNHKYYGYKCIGFLDDEIEELNGCRYLGPINLLPQILENEEVDEIIIAMPNTYQQEIRNCIDACDYVGKRVRMIPDLSLYTSSNIQVNNIGLLPVINLRSLPQDRWSNKAIKRVFDVVFATMFFVLIGWWFMPLVALLIKLTSKGPVFFKQERWGLNNKRIICYKFRTMYFNSPEQDKDGNFIQASKNDARITPIGKYLRALNIDEFPQFWNVLIGNMSVVGPRPHVTPLNLSSMESVNHYMLRHLVKPGITGWAQVNGSRGETSAPGAMQRRVNYDLYYIHQWTFLLDCQIILQTIINLIKGDDNAY